MNRRRSSHYQRNPFWLTCFCAESRTNMLDEADCKLARYIQRGNVAGADKLLKKLKMDILNMNLIVKRRHLTSSFQCMVDRNSDPFINFYEECSPVLWALDCQQWDMMRLLIRFGFDINRPQPCKRWTCLCDQNPRPNIAPYKRFWTRGKYTYQSVLDYYFASIYEFIGDDIAGNTSGKSSMSSLAYYFSQLNNLLDMGVDVHKIDSVIVFNSLAYSFDRYLCHYTNENAVVPDIPETGDDFVEMSLFKLLVENGFSQFECMEYLHPCCNWYGILICLVCHPKIDGYENGLLPPIIQESALLLINLLSLRCAFPEYDDFKENLEILQLRKIYSKRYSERRGLFNQQLITLQKACQMVTTSPLPLHLLARNMVRKKLGGINFPIKLAALQLPGQVSRYVSYIQVEHLKSLSFPEPLVSLARGYNICSTTSDA